MLVTEFDLNRKIKTLATKEDMKAVATKADKIVKLQTYDLSLVIGQSYFNNDESQSFLIFQPLYYNLKRLGNTEKFVSWKSKDLTDKKRTTPTTTDNSLSLSINWYEN